jgi:hypothetical protein
MVTASGGAWNASIIAEYFRFRGQVMTTTGLGAQIAAATDEGQFSVHAGCDDFDFADGGYGEPAGVASHSTVWQKRASAWTLEAP